MASLGDQTILIANLATLASPSCTLGLLYKSPLQIVPRKKKTQEVNLERSGSMEARSSRAQTEREGASPAPPAKKRWHTYAQCALQHSRAQIPDPA
jgi:hypothetical protein